MKRWIILLSILSLLYSVSASQDRLSTSTKRLISKIQPRFEEANRLGKTLQIPPSTKRRYLIHKELDQHVVHSIIRVDDTCSESELNGLGIQIRSRFREFRSVSIPLKNLHLLSDIDGVLWVEVDTPLQQRLDLAGEDVKAHSVHQGVSLPQGYTGDGVIVGIVDGGYDYTHPVFEDGDGNLRIMSAWDQSDNAGPNPPGFSYGTEYDTDNEIWDAEHDLEATEGSHGTHVAGIAAGSAADENELYQGMAPDADLVLVTLGGGGADVWDAIQYIFDQADAAGLPAVVNMSLGSHVGPHDGTSQLDQIFDGLIDTGRILIGAAGNEADSQLHIKKDLTGDTLKTAPFMPFYEDEQAEWASIESWGSANSTFSVAAGLFDMASQTYVTRSNFFASNGSSNDTEAFYQGADGEASIDIAATAKHPDNDRPNIFIDIQNTTSHSVVLFVTSTNSTVHLWHADEAPFLDLGLPGMFQTGDGNTTVGEIGGTSKSVISVGAYTTKNQYVDINGQTQTIAAFAPLGQIAPFSSQGPTVDGRTKPEITAPGNVVVSATSSFEELMPGMDVLRVEEIQGIWPYDAYEGTSMSTPMITGIVALMLEANPNLSRSDIVSIFKETGRSDGFTGTIPDNGSNTWGFGKVDALTAVQKAVDHTYVQLSDVIRPDKIWMTQNYPNPFNPETTIQFAMPNREIVRLAVYNMQGREMDVLLKEEKMAGIHSVKIDGSLWPSGLYVCQLRIADRLFSQKIVLMK